MEKCSRNSFRQRLCLLLSLLSGISLAAQTPGELGEGTDLGGGWYASDWLGGVYVAGYPWINKPGHGWMYHIAADGEGRSHWLYVYDPGLGWTYTGTHLYPDLYRADSGTWLRYMEGTREPGQFYDFGLEQYWEEGREPSVLHIRSHKALIESVSRARRIAGRINRIDRYPIHTEVDGTAWETRESRDWTAGFWPGMLWMLADFSGDAVLERLAERWQQGMAGERFRTNTHDLGFMIFNSFGKAHLLGFADYRDEIIDAAGSLARRFDDDVGALRSWSWGDWDKGSNFTVIVDNMMNLELLLWAADQNGGDPAWREMAIDHADTTMEHFFREDGSVYHVVVFDENSGEVRERTTHQGYSADSVWSRGQAWAIYGYAMMYRETGEIRFLEQAEVAADYFLANLPADGIPYWDFSSPLIPDDVKDSSAASIAASALLETSALVADEAEANRYAEAAAALLQDLLGDGYFTGQSTDALLAAGTYNWKDDNKDTGTIWGDYYFVEALRRYLLLGGFQ